MEVTSLLEQAGIQPSAQRVAVGRYVLRTQDHPSAEQVMTRVRARHPELSRATVYNTLNLLVDKGLLRALVLAEGRVVFDPDLTPHHHLVDDVSGAIHDIPWSALEVRGVERLRGFEVTEHQVVLRGRARRRAKTA